MTFCACYATIKRAKTRSFLSTTTRTAFAVSSTTTFPTTTLRTCRAMSLLSLIRMRRPLQDTPTMLGVYVLLRWILLASQQSTPSDIVVTTSMKRLGCIICRVDITMLLLVGLLILMRQYMQLSPIV